MKIMAIGSLTVVGLGRELGGADQFTGSHGNNEDRIGLWVINRTRYIGKWGLRDRPGETIYQDIGPGKCQSCWPLRIIPRGT
jgi:hypothetical protein